jgi:hypothetical protein
MSSAGFLGKFILLISGFFRVFFRVSPSDISTKFVNPPDPVAEL